MSQIARTAIIHANVRLGRNAVVEDFCIIGCAPRGFGDGALETVIGDDCMIRSHTVIYAGNTIGHAFQAGNKANIRELNTIGNRVSIGTLSVIEHHVLIEDDVRIHTHAFIPEYSVLREASWIGPNVVLTNAKYPASAGAKSALRGVEVMRAAKLGANCTVLPGIRIGERSLVGAGSVVTADIEADAVYAGNPARRIKQLHELPY